MTKTLDEILKRDDYKKLTSQLEDRTIDIAVRIRRKMTELDIKDEIITIKGTSLHNTVRITVKKVHTRSVGSYSYLAMDCSSFIEEDWASLEDVDNSFYYAGDFGAWVQGAPRKAALVFLNAAGRIIQRLGEIEDEQIKAVTAALENTENI